MNRISTRLRRFVPAAALVLAIGPFLAACSSGLSGAERTSVVGRSAAAASGIDTSGFSNPIGDPATAIDADNWCLRPQDGDGATGFRYVRNITVCQVMVNATKRFTGPGVLGGGVTIGVVKADCSGSDYTCRDVGGDYYGEVRGEGASARNVTDKGDRYAKPNPFLVKSAIQFMPKKIWQGVTVRTYVGANTVPFALGQSQAQMYSSIPTSGSNKANCTNGAFVSCTLVTPQSAYESGSNLQFEYRFSNLPASIQIANSTGKPIRILGSSQGTAGTAFLIDPIAVQNIDRIPVGGSGLLGGYFGTSTDSARSWNAAYCVEVSETDCVQVDVTIRLVMKDNALVDDSLCVVSPNNTYSARCEKPVVNGGDSGRFYTVTIR